MNHERMRASAMVLVLGLLLVLVVPGRVLASSTPVVGDLVYPVPAGSYNVDYPVHASGPTLQWTWANPTAVAAYQVQVLRGGVLIHDSGSVSGAATSYKMPDGTLELGTTDVAYSWRVRGFSAAGAVGSWASRTFATNVYGKQVQVPIADTYVQYHQGTPSWADTNYGSAMELRFGYTCAGCWGMPLYARAYAKYEGPPPGVVLTQADLEIPSSLYNSSWVRDVRETTRDWSEQTMTWNNGQPSLTSTTFPLPPTYSQVRDVRASTTWSFQLNRWQDWTHDSIPSRESGSGLPLRLQYHTIPTTPGSFASPIGGGGYRGTIAIQWGAASDGLVAAADLQYEIQVSVTGGSAWSPVATVQGTSYAWDTSILPDGDRYKLRVRAMNGVAFGDWVTSGTFSLDNVSPVIAGASLIAADGSTTYTNSPAVEVGVTAADALSGLGAVRLSNDGTTWTTVDPVWSHDPYGSARVNWTLTGADGLKTVHVQVLDVAGNPISTTAQIILDRAPPLGSAVINGGETYTTTPVVTLELSATDPVAGVEQMRFRTGSEWSDWENFASTKILNLPPGDGLKVVSFQFRDRAGNVSDVFTAAIVLDTTPPAGSVVINGGDTYTRDRLVTLSIDAADALSGVEQMRFSTDGSTWTEWELYAANGSLELPPGDGLKSVQVQLKDVAGNVGAPILSGIVLDTVLPVARVQINGGAPVTKSRDVILTMNVSDERSGVHQMRVSGGDGWTPWETTAFARDLTLPPGDGTKAVSLQVRDHAGNISETHAATILLDQTPPVGSVQVPELVASTQVPVTLSATDPSPGSGVESVIVSINGGPYSAPQAFATGMNIQVPSLGSHTIAVRFIDGAGNLSETYQAGTYVAVDTPPALDAQINDGAATTTSPSVILSVWVSDAQDPLEALQCRASNDGSNWSAWDGCALTLPWTLSPGNGVKQVYVQARDTAGNITGVVRTITLLADSDGGPGMTLTASGATVEHDGLEAFATRSSRVNLNLSVEDASRMRIRYGSHTWGEWEPFSPATSLALMPSEGLHEVQVQTRFDSGGIASTTVYFLVDRTPPDVRVAWAGGATATRNGSATLMVTASDNVTPAADLQYGYSTDGGASWVAMAGSSAEVPFPGSGLQTVLVRVSDQAGNQTITSLRMWVL